MKKVLSIFLSLAMLLSTISIAQRVQAKTTKDTWNFERYGDTIDIGPQLRAMDNDPEMQEKLKAEIMASAEKLNNDANATEDASDDSNGDQYIGTKRVFVANDDINGAYLKYFTLRAIGDKCEVWVADNLAYPEGDPRPTPVITDEQVAKVIDAFDNNIYEKDTAFFGTPDSHTGENALLTKYDFTPIDGTERVIILVDNVRDDNYYNPDYPFYVAGFYWGTIESYTDRNIITIDTLQWETRLENTYLPTVAHEFQHLIHADNDSAEETWINEGMSDFAEYLCGYGQPDSHINYFLDHPENSLVSWDEYYGSETGAETLADYGQAYLLQLYMDDQYGRDFIQALAKDPDHGIASVNKILKQFNTGIDFNELFRRFSVALVVDSPNPGNGIYDFKSIDLHGEYQLNFESALANNKAGVPAWGADYIKLENAKDIKQIKFSGIDFLPVPWTVVNDPLGSGTKAIFSGEGDELSNSAVLTVDLTGKTSATLKFDNLRDIEEQWDFGMVQVSTDGGKTWVSLENENTRSDVVDNGYPAIKENVPGFTGFTGYVDDSDPEDEKLIPEWTTEVFDLTPYVGGKVLINFRYMTDWASNGNGALDVPGWYIKNIEIPEIGYKHSCNTVDGFESIQKVLGIYSDYMVTFVNEKYTKKGTTPQHYQVKTLDPVNITSGDEVEIKKFLSSGNNYMIVWYAAPEGVRMPIDYSYQLITKANKK